MSVGEFKSNFSQVLKDVEKGEEIVVTFGKNHKKIAIIKPFKEKKKSLIGALKGKGEVVFGEDFEMTMEELIGL